MEALKILIVCLGYVLIFITLLPLIRHDYWIFRVFEYPRIQKLVLNIVVILAFVNLYELNSLHDKLFSAFLILNIGYLSFQIYPFTFLAKKQVIKGQ